MLIRTNKHTPADLQRWEILRKTALVHAGSSRHGRRVEEARDTIASFSREPCYAGTSWGKDSVALAHLISLIAPSVPVVWVRVDPRCNPECVLVEREFLAAHRINYRTIVVHSRRVDGKWESGLTSGKGFAEASARFGARHISGVRADESKTRQLRVATHGLKSARACAPLGRWSALDVFGYLLTHDLPIHPAYAYLLGGRLDPCRVRVASLDGERGAGWGRAQWEAHYYGPEVRAARLASKLFFEKAT